MTFEELYQVIEERKRTLPEGSGTTKLLTRGLDSILPKLNEECFETGLAIETQGRDDVALEVSQVFYYIVCLAVFLGEPYSSLDLMNRELEGDVKNNHDLAKQISRVAATVCHTPCLGTINRLPPLLHQALSVGESDLEHMFTYL
jgi:phosphoribosyl-ATP pyrophosphohydrolase